MERISQADVTTVLEKLHQELKAQTRDSKTDQHHLLRKAFHYVTATLFKPLQLSTRSSGPSRKISEVTHRVLQELFALLVGGDGFAPPRIRLLGAALVRELSAGDTPYFFRDNFGGDFSLYDSNKVKYFMPVLSELSNSKLLIQNISNLVNWFVNDEGSLGLKMAALSNLIALVQRFPSALDKDLHIRRVEAKFKQILTAASLETRKTTSTTLFGVRIVSTSSACNVTEIDGTPSRDCFTCMNNSYDYSEDQVLNVHVFSSLYYWIFHLYQNQLLKARKKQSRDDIVSKLEHFGLTPASDSHDRERRSQADECVDNGWFARDARAMAGEEPDLGDQRFSKLGRFTLDDDFREAVISICLRILSQVEREIVGESVTQMRLGSKYIISDIDWMREFTEATSMEAVRILDLICLMDPALVSCIFPAVKKVYERTANRQSGLVFSAVLQFFVNHGQHVIFDVDPVLHHFCVDYVSVRYRQQLLAMSTLLFLTTNTSKMLLHTPVFPKYYPAIIKLLAWHPRTVASEILPLIPAMVGPTTFTELFHTLLDLPLTAAFMEQYDRPEEHIADAQWSRLGLDRMAPAFKTVQQYIMRNEAGIGGVCVWETKDEAQLSMIRVLWNSLPVTPRVSSVCKLVPRFLRVYMNVLLSHAPPSCIERVVPLLLQRCASLYPVDFFLNAVHSLIIDTLQAIFQQWPSFLISLKSEVVHAISMHLDVQGRLLVLHLCWIIGELLSPAMCSDCKGDVTVFFEALEMLAYEAISVRTEDPADKKRRTLRGLQGVGCGTKGEAEPQAASAAASGADLEGSPSAEDAGGAGADFEEGPVGGGAAGRASEAAEEEASEGVAKREDARDLIFTPRFIVVIIASLTKLGTKFPEFSPRVILCLLKMRQHYEADFAEGIEFVRDRLNDSLQLLRHSAIMNSVYCSQILPGMEPDRFFSFHLSELSSLSHISHNPTAFTRGALLHDFELPLQPPMTDESMESHTGKASAAPWDSVQHAAVDALPTDSSRSSADILNVESSEVGFRSSDRYAELRRVASLQGVPRATGTGASQSHAPVLRVLAEADGAVEGGRTQPPNPLVNLLSSTTGTAATTASPSVPVRAGAMIGQTVAASQVSQAVPQSSSTASSSRGVLAPSSAPHTQEQSASGDVAVSSEKSHPSMGELQASCEALLAGSPESTCHGSGEMTGPSISASSGPGAISHRPSELDSVSALEGLSKSGSASRGNLAGLASLEPGLAGTGVIASVAVEKAAKAPQQSVAMPSSAKMSTSSKTELGQHSPGRRSHSPASSSSEDSGRGVRSPRDVRSSDLGNHEEAVQEVADGKGEADEGRGLRGPDVAGASDMELVGRLPSIPPSSAAILSPRQSPRAPPGPPPSPSKFPSPSRAVRGSAEEASSEVLQHPAASGSAGSEAPSPAFQSWLQTAANPRAHFHDDAMSAGQVRPKGGDSIRSNTRDAGVAGGRATHPGASNPLQMMAPNGSEGVQTTNERFLGDGSLLGRSAPWRYDRPLDFLDVGGSSLRSPNATQRGKSPLISHQAVISDEAMTRVPSEPHEVAAHAWRNQLSIGAPGSHPPHPWDGPLDPEVLGSSAGMPSSLAFSAAIASGQARSPPIVCDTTPIFGQAAASAAASSEVMAALRVPSSAASMVTTMAPHSSGSHSPARSDSAPPMQSAFGLDLHAAPHTVASGGGLTVTPSAAPAAAPTVTPAASPILISAAQAGAAGEQSDELTAASDRSPEASLD